MSAAPLTDPARTIRKRPDGARPSIAQVLEAELAPHYQRRPVRKTIEKMERLERWRRAVLARSPGDDPVVIVHRSFSQLFRALELERTGHIKADRKRFRNSVALLLDYATEIGMFAGWEEAPRKPNGEGTGILVRLRRDSSVGRAHLPGRRRMRRFSSCTKSAPPLREKAPSNGSKRSDVGRENGWGARVRTRGPGVAGHRATAAAIRALQEAGEEGGAAVLRRRPWLRDLAPGVLLRAAAFAYAPQRSSGWARSWRPLLRSGSRCQAEAAVAQLDELEGRGAGAALIIDLAAGGWRQHVPAGTPFPEPRTPGAIVRAMRREVRLRVARRAACYGLEPPAVAVGPVEDLEWT